MSLACNTGRFIYIKARWIMFFHSTILGRQLCWNHKETVQMNSVYGKYSKIHMSRNITFM